MLPRRHCERSEAIQTVAAERFWIACARNDEFVEAIAPHSQSSYPAKAGYPVRRGLSVLAALSLEYWTARLRRR
ncbi:bsr3027 [Bradyrhizobium diazoefficiens USDA 110]|uniref:Bsr3027 protein n=1 Tax=Bradyrhizobium diazoefficiens (strain JCM 10833 / BCRC 13528 / IAM 13628 / NBRC 14792 / USDA 110) TaxID=224911 RepID=Q89QU7_BRADU|nr:bsr3027 [Bradyrhizobium diazoefficiens USDA 110]